MRIMDKLVCQFCREEMDLWKWDDRDNLMDSDAFYMEKMNVAWIKLRKSICIKCLMQYIEKFQHLQKWNDEKTDPRHHDYGLEIG
jgi:hypothetical protein